MHNYIYTFIYFHGIWMLCLFDINWRDYATHILCIYNCIFISILISKYIICIDMHGSSSSNSPQMWLITTIYKLSTDQRFSYFLMAGPWPWNKLQNIRIWDGLQCPFDKFHDFNAVFSFTKITTRLSKMVPTEDGAGAYFTKLFDT